ncbi:bis(5'-nucleosyl)-tetraphosphatase [Proteiniclasticum ruminis]|uniref:Bis(5'-nucleosyl)-tetraphosphatase [asymmetrical] n=1 Tax=Proteiniclasticum ruminis TaxID=398199 RepID=A0A1G8LB14_9CLOT|nr:NUDIX domain-containing protein [Proteiniclasticum ruminis]SDI52884.1 tRNA nucleotidyltransferase (CCA-adding enzyme) [Proteiniclasticum ruminis]
MGIQFGQEREKSYGAVIINEKKEFLLIRHKNGGHWDFPKGHKEAGESSKETALREVLEETGLTVRLIEGFKEKSRYSPKPGVEKTVTFYLGFSMGEVQIQEEEILDFEYLTYDEAKARITFKESKSIIASAKQFIDTYLQSNED